ncbi:MAG TPA: peptidoglycan binding domain-containing protein, partial [Dehalococcoidia bacterium]|nr:peptidoglycan binding domain-containing protein [Dehalococcoidia bacterium]
MIGFQVATWDKIAPGVVALGTPVGGLSQTEAAARLRPQIETLLNRPLQIRYAELAWNTTARELGLRLDPTDLVQAAYRVGREGGPIARFAEQLGVLAGGQHLVVSSTTDQAALDESLDRIAREVDRPAQDARLTLGTDGTVHFMGARIGLTVDVAGSRARVLRALGDSSPFVELVVRETAPVITNEMVQPAREQLERLLGGGTEPPLTLTFGEQKWLLERSEVIQLLSLEGGTKAGQPVTVNIDEASLRALAERLANEVDQSVQDARFAWNGGNLKPIRESREGRELDQAATVALVRAKLVAGERWAELPVTVVKPAVSSKDAKSLGIVGLIDRGSTSFAGSIAEKKHNIRLAAERLNGVVVPPGGTFSFNKEVGPTTLAAGFKWGFGITSGEEGVKTVPSVAGGICQVATTLFQPVFWAGYPLEERYWH